MKIYLRILTYAQPIRRLVPFYFLAIILTVVFGLINFSMLIPLLDILFSSADITEAIRMIEKPTFFWSVKYLKDLFQYYFMYVIATEGRVKALYFVCFVIIISVLLTNIFRYLAEIIVAEVRTKIVYNLRMKLFDNVSQLHLAYFINHPPGNIISRITSDVQEIEYVIVDLLRVLFKEPVTITGFFVVMYHISSKLTILSLGFLPVAGLIIAYILGKLRENAVQTQASIARLVSILQEALSGMRIIKAFVARPYIMNRFKEENGQYAQENLLMEVRKSMAPPMSEFLGVGVVTFLIAYEGAKILMGQADLTPSTFFTYIICFSQALVPIKSISRSFTSIQRGRVAGKRIFELIDTPSEITNQPTALPIHSFEKEICFKDVTFFYQHQQTLKNVNLTIRKGMKIAIVGPSGGGKSTIVNLLARFYDATTGEITIDGMPVKTCNIYALRKLMGMVTQENILLHDTVYNNIAFGRPEADEASVMAAAEIAHAHQFIMELPQQYQTIVGERGNKLSGGQAQRLGIARAVLGNPPILILDEATSDLDSASEQLVQGALEQYMKDITAIIISHRLSTIRHADEILVIDQGEIVARGTHEALMAQAGLYTNLTNIQAIE